jgi:hypothetical protein
MRSELNTLFWLQVKLTRSIFRGRRTTDRLRVMGLVSRILLFSLTLPLFGLMAGALAVGMILLSPRAAFELAMTVNVVLFFIWLLTPASYNSQLAERFEMSRLFLYPIHYRSIVVGSTLVSLLTMTGLWTALILAGEIVGLAWHQPLALPLLLIGAIPVFALLVLTGRIMEDFFDLVADDRRLRGLVIGLLSLPFMFCWVGQYAVQFATANYQEFPDFARVPFLEGMRALDQATSLSEFLEILRPSRLLIWLPPGWATAGMGLAARGDWGLQLLLLVLSITSVALLLWAHAGITRRLMRGAALSAGTARVRSRSWRWRLPGPPPFWAAFHKDWIYLWRSPLPRRLIFSALASLIAMAYPLLIQSRAGLGPERALIVGAFAMTVLSGILNMGLTGNYFGAIDREGFATLAFSAIDRRQVIVSANLAVLLFASALFGLLALGLALFSRSWEVFPLGLFLGLCLQIGGAPAYNLAAILGPYRAELRYRRGRQRGNLWAVASWFLSAFPIIVMLVVPYLFWRPGLALTMPAAALYCGGLYALTLKPLAQLLQRNEYDILAAVTAHE